VAGCDALCVICGSFRETVSISDFTAPNDAMINT
jgi:hypothetical protein